MPQDAIKHLEEERARLEELRLLREANMAALRPDEADLRRLDASVKRNTALTKKLRGITEESRAGLLDDIHRTNQGKVTVELILHVHALGWRMQGMSQPIQLPLVSLLLCI